MSAGRAPSAYNPRATRRNAQLLAWLEERPERMRELIRVSGGHATTSPNHAARRWLVELFNRGLVDFETRDGMVTGGVRLSDFARGFTEAELGW